MAFSRVKEYLQNDLTNVISYMYTEPAKGKRRDSGRLFAEALFAKQAQYVNDIFII